MDLLDLSSTSSEDSMDAKPKKKTKRRGPRLTGVSKQRRLANARERSRVHTLNANIDRLKDILPLFPDEKPSKTETIRIAAVYIAHLTELLENTEKPAVEFEPPPFEDFTFPTFNFDPFGDPGELIDLFWGET
ncbi:transcription factor Atoh1 [Nematostella vectensis]|nr:transcription factor Atoh1 [Nematostella vectensis]